jgi:tetratricopeptide (TPR) repeat protein
MSRTARLWRGAGFLMLGGLLLPGVPALADDDPPLSQQLTELGRQALAQGAAPTAETFFQKALKLDPNNKLAAQGLEDTKQRLKTVTRVALQEPANAPTPPATPAAPAPGTPAPPEPGQAPAEPGQAPAAAAPADQPAAAAPDNRATIAQTEAAEQLARQQLSNDVEQRLQTARQLLERNQPESAINALRLALNLVRSATNVLEADRNALDRRIQAQMVATVQAEERIVAERAERQRMEAAAEQRTRAVDVFQRNKETIAAIMVQFDSLMSEGVYNVLFTGGLGDIRAATEPFYQARLLAQKAYALQRGAPLPYSDNDPAPALGERVADSMNFFNQELLFTRLKDYRFLLTMQDVTRAQIPFPDNQFIEYPDADWWRYISEKRIKRWGHAVDLFENSPRTRQIKEKLDEPIPMSFASETPLDDVLKYIKQATTTPSFPGIPIYVDPIGLQEAERSLNSTVTMDLEGVPLKTTLRLMLKQLGLAYTVKDGFLMITSEDSEDQQTEIRVYPVADLAIIPLSLMMGGGGGMGGGMGGMGMMGGGGMGGGMGGMGGGMGGMGGGMMGGGMGMMSIPTVDPQVPGETDDAYAQKKSN